MIIYEYNFPIHHLATEWIWLDRCPFNKLILSLYNNQRIMLKQPSTNVKMTNVATIRYKINKKDF